LNDGVSMVVELQVSWDFGMPRILPTVDRWVVQFHPSCSRDQLRRVLSATENPDLVAQALSLWAARATRRSFAVNGTTLSIFAAGDNLLNNSETTK